ncbi:MAG: hypothetical protein HFG97_14900 [Dorea sp.]|nr:hypothetical protein [Dorea sp.]
MKERFKQLPEALQRQVMIRAVGGIVFLILFIVIQLSFGDIYLSLPCLLFGLVTIVNGGRLLYNSLSGNYLCVQGMCEQIETTGIRKRVKSICISIEKNMLRIPVRRRAKSISRGDTVVLYLSDKIPVYEKDGEYMIYNYYALEIKKEV